MKRRTFLMAATVTVAGCMNRATRSNPFERGEGASSVRINVENRNFNQATLYAEGAMTRRLGIVGGNTSESFTLPWPSDGDLRIRIDILAGTEYTTNTLGMRPGDTANLIIDNPVYRSLLRR